MKETTRSNWKKIRMKQKVCNEQKVHTSLNIHNTIDIFEEIRESIATMTQESDTIRKKAF